MATRVLIFILIFDILLLPGAVNSIVIHITASSDDQCRGNLCLSTLSLLFHINYFTNATDITLIFEAGNHSLESEFLIANVRSLYMITNDTSFNHSNVHIICNNYERFAFINIHKVYVKGLNFVGCIGNRIESINQFISEDSSFIGKRRYHSTRPTGHFSVGSILRVSQHTSATFIRTSFRKNEYGTKKDVIHLYHNPQIGRYETVLRRIDHGGAIYATESKIEIVECLFERNWAGLGGAIYIANKSIISVSSSSFLKNVAYHHYKGLPLDPYASISQGEYYLYSSGGGAIHVHHTSLFITNCSFIDNAAQNGGALTWNTNNGTINIVGSNFTDNLALDGGGALWWGSARTIVAIINCSFINNRAVKRDRSGGGAIKLTTAFNTTTIISGNLFNNNSAHDKSGGVISISENNQATIIVSNNHFINNHAGKNGGVVSFLKNGYVHDFTDIILNDNLFNNNSALEDGGVLELKNANVKIIRSNFIGNGADGNGGTLFIMNGKLDIVDNLFQFNTAGNDGGVIVSESNDISISESNFISNSVNKGGHAGVFKIHQGLLSITETSLVKNKADFGGVLWAQMAEVKISEVFIFDNSANTDGGVFHTEQTQMVIMGVNFVSNRADNNGGIMHTDRDRISVIDCKFDYSKVASDGGVIRSYLSEVNVSESTFVSNIAGNDGGVYHIEQSNLTIGDQSFFMDNRAEAGGVIWNDAGMFNINQASFINNTANTGGVIWTDAGTADIEQASFTSNKAITGAVMWADRATISGNTVSMNDNHANYTIIYSLETTIKFTDILLASNNGSLCAIESTVTLTDAVMTKIQTVNQSSVNRLEQGGAITAFQSEIMFEGTIKLIHNRAHKGGAIHLTEAKLHIHGTVTLANNTALQNGGSIYLYKSELTCQSKSRLQVIGNIAMENGGGIHAAGSSIKVKVPVVQSLNSSMLSFTTNRADKGGGIFLEMDSKAYILKSIATNFDDKHEIVKFTANEANYGGAVYVSDDGMCALSTSNKECFFQALALYGNTPLINFESDINRCKNIHFERNKAGISGHSLYGGLLDRCKVSPLAEVLLNDASEGDTLSNRSIVVSGLAYFRSISNIQSSDIASPPVRVCFCRNGQPDCSYNPSPIPIRRGQLTEIPLSLAALDQINRPIEATIYNRLSSRDDLCQHHIQTNDGNCSVITFTTSLSYNESQKIEELILLTDGPCKEMPNSQAKQAFNVYCPTCPVGFELVKDEEGCSCRCDKNLLPFISYCRPSSNTLVRDRNTWIAYINTSDDSDSYQYLIHPYCPLDYCHPPSSLVEINLNLPNGSDSQCANGRSGLLCGRCQPGLSLSLGSSSCITCPSHWPINLTITIIAAMLAGVLLVALGLLLNFTVAVGTLNEIIFYANILAVSNSTFLHFSTPNFATVFISWLNLEVGIDVCFFKGMDAFWKSLLQLAFPAYIISLVVVVILISEHSRKFSNFIGKWNPVATLATLLLLSYTTLLHAVITALSFAILNYPDGSQRIVWLADASIDYLSGKHIGLLIIASFILIAGVFYTAILFSWQWLLRFQNCCLLKLTKSTKLCHFIEPYHVPYTFKHRYWTGLLLLSRVILYLVSAINTTGDPRVTIVAVSLIIGSLLLIKGVLANKVYKNRLIDATETIVYFNLLVLAALTWYNLDAGRSQAAVAYISITIIFVLNLAVIAYHVYQYTNLSTLIKRTWLFKRMVAKMHLHNGRSINQLARECGNSKCNVSESESVKNHNKEPTYSVVELNNPQVYSSNYY